VPFKKGDRVAGVDAGHYHTTLLSEAGAVAECGRGVAMRLCSPTIHGVSVEISSIACGGTWTVAHSRKALQTFLWDEGDALPIPGLKDVPLLDVQAGKWEALFLTEDSRVLSMPFEAHHVQGRFVVADMRLGERSVTSLACGTSMNAALTVDGKLMGWKRDGSSGLVSAPHEIPLPNGEAFASSVHCGGRIWACAVSEVLCSCSSTFLCATLPPKDVRIC
jgi:hypothetical protein